MRFCLFFFIYAVYSIYMEEIFITISQYPEYKVSNYGNIRMVGSESNLKLYTNKAGYNHVYLMNRYGNTHFVSVHQLVGRMFLDNPNNCKIVDHINNDKTDNNIMNLRWVSYAQNGMNKKLSIKNKTGYAGVRFDEYHKKYRADIGYNGKLIIIGYYTDFDDAVMARITKSIELYGKHANKYDELVKKKQELDESYKQLEEEFENLIKNT